MHLTNNLTFAILVNNGNWKTDLTIRFCEYFSHKFNGENFIKNIVFPSTINSALEDCTTDYLLIQSDGHIPFKKSFFKAIENSIENNSDIFLAHLELAHDYILIDDRCIFVNMKLWREVGKPAFASQVREGPRFKISQSTENKNRPAQIIIDSPNDDKCFVTAACSTSGAGFIIAQLNKFGKATSLSGVLTPDESHYLDSSSPYRELHTETFFEKKFLNHIRTNVFALEDDDMSQIKNVSADIVVCPAQGLKPLNLVEYFKASKLVIFDSNPYSLELQKLIFSVEEPTLYSDIIETFQEEFPNANVINGWKEDEYAVVKPVKNINIEYKIVDAFSFEIEDLIKSINHKPSAVFDLSDIFVYPYNYYRRPLYQVQGLFAEIYSLMKSRTGATHILGYAPGFLNMDKIEVNTSSAQYELDPTIDPNAVEEVEITSDEIEIPIEEDKPSVVFAPETSLAPEENKSVYSLPSANEDVKNLQNTSIFVYAIDKGYTKTIRSGELNSVTKNLVVLNKLEIYDDWVAVFEYFIDEITSEWSFKVGKQGQDKRIEFSNGLNGESFLKHLNQSLKINAKTAVKYFQDK